MWKREAGSKKHPRLTIQLATLCFFRKHIRQVFHHGSESHQRKIFIGAKPEVQLSIPVWNQQLPSLKIQRQVQACKLFRSHSHQRLLLIKTLKMYNHMLLEQSERFASESTPAKKRVHTEKTSKKPALALAGVHRQEQLTPKAKTLYREIVQLRKSPPPLQHTYRLKGASSRAKLNQLEKVH